MPAPTFQSEWLAVPRGCRPMGYAALILTYGLQLPPRPRTSFVSEKHSRRSEWRGEGRTVVTLPPQYEPGPSVCDQLEFALKHEGLDLLVLAALFRSPEAQALGRELEGWIRRKPSGQYARRAWFLYERLTGRELSLGPSTAKSYVPLLDPKTHYTARALPSPRHKVADNLLGPPEFCPIVRRTERLQETASLHLDQEVRRLLTAYDPDVLRRAVDFLYTQETRSTFKLEGEVPDSRRAHRFVAALRGMELPATLDEAALTRLQNTIVTDGGGDKGFRTEPVYIGEQRDDRRQLIHYVAPRAEDVPSMMAGLLACMRRMEEAGLDPIVQAAVAAFGFVFIHPFTDGNGRIHRALIHQVLSRSGFTPKGLLLPVSAVILHRRAEYDAALESISRPLMQHVDFDEVEDGRIEIRNDTALLYRFLDLTRLAEDLGRWTEQTIREELRLELDFITRYRKARSAMEEVVDLPDRLLNLFIQIVHHNGGKLSRAKRGLFDRLSDVQIERLEHAVGAAFQDAPDTLGVTSSD
jgi:Fic family protein